MTLKYSPAAVQFFAEGGSLHDAFQNGRIEIYSGAQPATANAAVTGTLLCTITDASAARTSEVLAAGTVTLTGGASGSVNTLTVNGVEIMGSATNFNTSLTQTAADIAAKCQTYRSSVEYTVTSSGAVITITAKPGTGAASNGFVVASTVTTITKTDANLAGGVTAVNGLKFDVAAGGVLSKLASQVWSGVNAAGGTAGWYRMYGSIADAGALDSSSLYIREDGAIATTAAELNMASTTLTISATTSITAWQRTITTL
ncbi:MAG: hypothetical protein ACYC36_02365 [Bellilinea sp.]